MTSPMGMARLAAALGLGIGLVTWMWPSRGPFSSQPLREPEIRFMHFGSFEDYQLWREIIRLFHVEYPHISIRQQFIAGWYGTYETKLRQQHIAGTMPELCLVQYLSFPSWAGSFADIHDLFSKSEAQIPIWHDFEPSALEAFVFNGNLRALPISGGNLLIYCNLDCFDRASRFRGYPVAPSLESWNLPDFTALAQDLTCDFDGDGRTDQFGFWQPQWVYALPFIWSFGADLFSDDGRSWAFTGPAATHAMQWYRDLHTRLRVTPPPADIAQMTQDTGFLTGKVAMCVNGPWFRPFLSETALASRTQVINIPSGPGGRWTRVTWDGIAVASDLTPTERERCAAFLAFVTTPNIQALFAAKGRSLPAVSTTLSDSLPLGDRHLLTPFAEALAYSRLQTTHRAMQQIDRVLNVHFRNILEPHNMQPTDQFVVQLAADPELRQALATVGAEPP